MKFLRELGKLIFDVTGIIIHLSLIAVMVIACLVTDIVLARFLKLVDGPGLMAFAFWSLLKLDRIFGLPVPKPEPVIASARIVAKYPRDMRKNKELGVARMKFFVRGYVTSQGTHVIMSLPEEIYNSLEVGTPFVVTYTPGRREEPFAKLVEWISENGNPSGVFSQTG